jgi:bacillithiol biosynthesis cysteine-adding enzyme BshC
MLSVHIIGGGSLGLLFAAKLATLPQVQTTLVVRGHEQCDAVRTNGVELVDPSGDTSRTRSFPACVVFADLPIASQVDVVLLAVKQTHIDAEFANKLRCAYALDVPIVCLQNGIGHLELLRESGSAEMVIGAVTTEGARKLDLRSVAHTGRGETVIGQPSPSAPPYAMMNQVVTALNNAGFTTIMTERIDFFIWRKLLINAVINPLTALTRLRNGELLQSPQMLAIIEQMCAELLKLADRAGIHEMDALPQWIRSVCEATAQNRSSMLQDVLAGRATELPAISGRLLEFAEQCALPMPLNQQMYELLTASRLSEGLMNVETIYWPQTAAFAQDYLDKKEQVVERLGGHDSDHDAWLRQAARLDQQTLTASRDALCDALLAFQRSIANEHNADVDSPALRAIHELRDNRTLVVVGGQQVGLFGGPLLVIHKAISILATAKRAQAIVDRPVVPVFWLAGEDHDWAEVNHLYVDDRNHKPVKISVNSQTDEPRSVSHRAISQAAWDEVLEQLRETLPHTEFSDEWFARLQDFAARSNSLTELFARLMHHLFASHGLIFVDAADPAIRKLEAEMFAALFANRTTLSENFLTARDELLAEGYEQPVQLQAGQTNLFVEHNKQRTMLFEQVGENGATVSDRRASFSMTQTEVEQSMRHHPDRFSNNVLTRPLMQQFLFPVVATVLGRAETAYWALLPEAFRTMGMNMPLVVVRPECTLIEPPIARIFSKTELSFGAATYLYEQSKKQWLEAQDEHQWPQTFANLKQSIADLYAPLIESLERLNPGIGQLGRQNLTKIEEQVRYLESRTTAAFEQQHSAFLRQWERLHQSLLPFGKPQERVYNVVAFINRNGFEWISHMVTEASDWTATHHHLAYLTPSKEEQA